MRARDTGTPLTDADAIARPTVRARIGRVWIDALSAEGALRAVDDLVRSGTGGSIFTPNVDHVMLAGENADFRRAYRRASLSFADGAPIIWAGHLLRTPFPEKLSGSDMMLPIARLAARMGWRVYLLGGENGVAEQVAALLRRDHGVDVVGVDSPLVHVDGGHADEDEVIARITEARPHVLFVALGSPKQEIWIDRVLDSIRPTVAIGVGATFDFLVGRVRRAPAWMSRAGLEWLYRLVREPRRLWHRYLVRDPAFVLVLLRTLAVPRKLRVRPGGIVSR